MGFKVKSNYYNEPITSRLQIEAAYIFHSMMSNMACIACDYPSHGFKHTCAFGWWSIKETSPCEQIQQINYHRAMMSSSVTSAISSYTSVMMYPPVHQRSLPDLLTRMGQHVQLNTVLVNLDLIGMLKFTLQFVELYDHTC